VQVQEQQGGLCAHNEIQTRAWQLGALVAARPAAYCIESAHAKKQ